jgi:AraC-like DNA-binding protein
MAYTITALNTGTKALLEICGRRGMSSDDLLKAAKLDASSMEKYNRRIPADKKRLIWEEVFRRTGDEQIGFCASQVVPFGGYGVLDYLLMATSTPAEVLSRVSRLYRLINNFAELRLETHKNSVMVELYNPTSASRKWLGLSAEFSFGVLISRLQSAYGSVLKPENVCFTHPPPADVSMHHRLFQSPIRFGQSVNRLVFNKDALKISLPQSDAALAEMLEHQAQRLLKNLSLENDITEEIRAVLRSRLSSGNADINTTAKALAMSGRNLQRKLNGQGTCYREVLDKLRYEMALDYITQQIDASEITRLLGFSEISTFQRAFKRWSAAYSQNP